MSQLKSLLYAASLALLAVPAASRAAVNLSFTDNDATPTSASVIRGTSFPFTLNLSTTAGEQTTGVDYFLQSSTSGIFTITSRSESGSAYPAVYATDASVAGQGLTPRNSTDLGGSVSNVNTPTSGAGPFKVADYVLSVSAAAPLGTYTLTTFSNPGTGYVGPGPTFSDNTFNSPGTFSVTVVPEPGGAAVAGLALLGLARRRRTS